MAKSSLSPTTVHLSQKLAVPIVTILLWRLRRLVGSNLVCTLTIRQSGGPLIAQSGRKRPDPTFSVPPHAPLLPAQHQFRSPPLSGLPLGLCGAPSSPSPAPGLQTTTAAGGRRQGTGRLPCAADGSGSPKSKILTSLRHLDRPERVRKEVSTRDTGI